MIDPDRVVVIPCSGIGKAYGSVGREAMYMVLEDLRPHSTATACLSLLTLGDQDARRLVREHPTITIDGCPKACARINVEAAGGEPAAVYRVFDVYRAHKDLRVRSVSELGESGIKMARILAEEITVRVDQLREAPGSRFLESLVVDELDEAKCDPKAKAGEK